MNWVYISDEVAADTDYFVTAARPNTSATMAQTTLAAAHNGGGRNVTVTTTGSGDGGKTATITKNTQNSRLVSFKECSTRGADSNTDNIPVHTDPRI